MDGKGAMYMTCCDGKGEAAVWLGCVDESASLLLAAWEDALWQESSSRCNA